MFQRRRPDPRPFEEASYPPLNRKVQFNTFGIEQQRDFPSRYGTEPESASALPAAIKLIRGSTSADDCRRYQARARYAYRAIICRSPVSLSTGLGIGFDIECRPSQIDILTNPHGSGMGAE